MSPRICPNCSTEHDAARMCAPSDRPALPFPTNDSSPGTERLIADRYRVIRQVGENSTGSFYLAEHVETGLQSTVKLLHQASPSGAQPVRFSRELWEASRIHHENVAAVYDVGETPDGLTYVIMEAVDGALLSDMLSRYGAPGARYALDLALQAASGLRAAHEVGIIHGNLTPASILVIRQRQAGDLIKIADFGTAELARRTGMGEHTEPGAELPYGSPELIRGNALDVPTDVFGVGAVLYHLLTGEPPFARTGMEEGIAKRLDGPPPRPRAVNDMVPRAVDDVVAKALSPASAERFQTVSEMHEALTLATTDALTRASAAIPIVTASAPTNESSANLTILPSEQKEDQQAVPPALWIGAGTLGVAAVLTAVWLLGPTRGSTDHKSARNTDHRSAALTTTKQVPLAPTVAPPVIIRAPRPPLATAAPAGSTRATTPLRRPSVARAAATTPSVAPRRAESDAQQGRVVASEAGGALAATRVDSESSAPAAPPVRIRTAPELTRAAPARPPATSPKPPPAATTRTEARAAPSDAITAYARAIESRDVAAVRRAYPGLTAKQRSAWQEFFGTVRDIEARLTIERLNVTGSKAEASVRGIYEYVTQSPDRAERSPVTFQAVLSRGPGGWRLIEIR